MNPVLICLIFVQLFYRQVFGNYSIGETPVPIPNTEVKPYRADGIMRAAAWESRSLPDLIAPNNEFKQ